MSQIFGINAFAGSNNRRQNYQQPNDFSAPAPVLRQPRVTAAVSAPAAFGSTQAPLLPSLTPQQAYAGSRSPAWNQSLVTSRDMTDAGNQAQEDTRAAGGSYVDANRAAMTARRDARYQGDHPPGPNVIVGGGGRSGYPVTVPGNSNIISPQTTQRDKAYNPADRAKIRQNYLGKPILDQNSGHVTGYSNYPGVDIADALNAAGQQADKDMSGNATPSPGIQPSQTNATPGASPAFNQTLAPAFPSPAGPNGSSPAPGQSPNSRIQMTDQDAREAWRNSLAQFGGNLEAAGQDFHQKMQHYGVDGHALLNQWSDAGTLHQNEQMHPATTAPGANIPLSTLGPNNGMSPQQNYGFPNQATPGPSIQQQGQVTPAYTTPFQGSTPLNEAPGPVQPAEMSGRTMASRMAMGSMLNYGGQSAQPASKGKQTAYAAKSAETSSAGSDGATHFSQSTGTYWKQVNGQWQQVR